MRSAALPILALALAACGGDDARQVVKESPVGSWRLEDPVRYAGLVGRMLRSRDAVAGQRSKEPFDEAAHAEKMRKHVITFGADGSFEDSDGAQPSPGTWTRNGNEVRARWRAPRAGAPENRGLFELTPDGFDLIQSSAGGGPPHERFRLVRVTP